jgi:hypothetical protein
MDKILLSEYCKRHGIDDRNARRKASSGGYKTAIKLGRDWFIDPDEPHIDGRIKSGKFIDRRNKK